MSACPATGEAMPFSSAASREMALSSASGPSTSAPRICIRSAILDRAAASSVAGMDGFTDSVAHSTATLGRSTPSERARSMAFCAMSAFSASVGAMLTAASVRMNSLG